MQENFFLRSGAFVYAAVAGQGAFIGQNLGNLSALMAIFPVAIFLILLVGAKVAGHGQFQSEPFGLENAKCLQGACALMIVFHHSSQEFVNNATGNPGALSLFYNAGVLLVAVFFFFSGYGLLKSVRTKPDYLKGFLRKRLLAVLIPFWVCTVVFQLAFALLGEPWPTLDILLSLCGVYLANPHMWYIVAIVLLYLLFWGAFRIFKNQDAALVAVIVPIVLFTLAGPCFGHGGFWFQGEWWYNTTLIFAVGMLAARYEKQILTFLQKYFIGLLLLFAAGFAILYRATAYALENWSYWGELGDAYRCLALQLPMVLCFIALLAVILQKVRFGNPVLRFLGKIGLEIYLLHNLFLQNLHDANIVFVQNEFLYVLLIVCGAVLLAVPVHALNQKLIHWAAGTKTAKPEKAKVE